MLSRERLEMMIQEYGAEHVIASLQAYLTDARFARIDQVIASRIHSVHIALESPYDILNSQAVVRSAEAMGVDHVHIITSQLKKNQGRKTASGASQWVNTCWYAQFHDFSCAMRDRGFLLAGASLQGKLTLEELPATQPICLVLGNENRGLSAEAAAECDLLYRIPMHGMVESFNLSVSASLSLQHLTAQRRAFLGTSGDLTQEQALHMRAKYYVIALGFQLSKMILEHGGRHDSSND